jgi:hypothetical protein
VTTWVCHGGHAPAMGGAPPLLTGGQDSKKCTQRKGWAGATIHLHRNSTRSIYCNNHRHCRLHSRRLDRTAEPRHGRRRGPRPRKRLAAGSFYFGTTLPHVTCLSKLLSDRSLTTTVHCNERCRYNRRISGGEHHDPMCHQLQARPTAILQAGAANHWSRPHRCLARLRLPGS